MDAIVYTEIAQLRTENARLRGRLAWFQKQATSPTAQPRVWSCTCGEGHYLSIHRAVDPDFGLDSYLTLDAYTESQGLWRRLKLVWKLLRGDHRLQHFDILLDPQIAREIAAELERAADFRLQEPPER